MAEPFHIRPATRSDVDALLALERRAFSDPWSAEAFVEALASPFGLLLLAETASSLAGYAVGRHVLGTAEILNLAVEQKYRRSGVARSLVARTMAQLRERGAREVMLEVRQSNEAAKKLYEEFGFQQVSVRRNYYRKPTESALVLRCELPRPA